MRSLLEWGGLLLGSQAHICFRGVVGDSELVEGHDCCWWESQIEALDFGWETSSNLIEENYDGCRLADRRCSGAYQFGDKVDSDECLLVEKQGSGERLLEHMYYFGGCPIGCTDSLTDWCSSADWVGGKRADSWVWAYSQRCYRSITRAVVAGMLVSGADLGDMRSFGMLTSVDGRWVDSDNHGWSAHNVELVEILELMVAGM